MSLPVVLARERLTAYGTDKRTLVCVCTKMRAQIVGTGEALGAECALEGRRMLLNSFRVANIGAGDRFMIGIRYLQYMVAVG